MSSVVEICNIALSNVRSGSINSIDEPSLAAQQCKLKYPFLRDMMLTETPWSFNHKIRALSVLTTEVFNWNVAYQYPVGCLKINRLVSATEELTGADAGLLSRLSDSQLQQLEANRPKVPYEVFNFSDNKVIAANEEGLRIDYAAKVTDPNLFSNNFTLALSHLLAAELAIPLAGGELGRQLRSDSLELYQAFLASAESDDLNEQHMDPPLSEYETIRS